MLIHFPTHKPFKDCAEDEVKGVRLETYQVMEEYVNAEKVKSIGLSNFCRRHIEHILANCKVKPVINQIEIHPMYYD